MWSCSQATSSSFGAVGSSTDSGPRPVRRATLLLVGLCVLGSPVRALAQDPVTPVRGVGQDVERAEGVTAVASARARGTGSLTFFRDIELRLGPFLVRLGAGAGLGLESAAGVSVSRASAEDSLANRGGQTGLGGRFFLDSGPAMDIVLPIGQRHLLSVSGEALYRNFLFDFGKLDLVRRGEFEDADGWQFRGTGGYEYQADRLGARATYEISRRQRTPSEFIATGGTAELGDIDARTFVLSEDVGAQLGIGLTPRTTLSLTGLYREEEHEQGVFLAGQSVSEALDRTEKIGEVSLRRQFTPRTSLALFGAGRRSDFARSQFRNHDGLQVGLRARFGELGPIGLGSGRAGSGGASGRLGGSISAGLQRVLVEDEGPEDYTGPFADGRVRFAATDRLGWWVIAAVRTFPTFWENNVYAINEGVGTGLDFRLLRDLGIGLFVDYASARYPEPTMFEQDDGELLTAKRFDQLWIYRGVISFRIFGQSLSIQGGYFDRSSNFDIADSRGAFLRLGLGMNEKVQVGREL